MSAARVSIIINVFLVAFLSWYFIIHKDISSYYDRYFEPAAEDFLEDIYYRAKVDSYAALNVRSKGPRAVFAGDSIVEQFPVEELLPGALNRGIGHDTSRGVLLRLEGNVNNLEVSRLFLMVGHNDLKYRSVEEAVANIALIFLRAKAARKYFISVLPTADREQDRLTRKLNDAVRRESAKGGFEFIDLHERFLGPDGTANPALYYDGVHLNAVGHSLLLEGLEERFGSLASLSAPS